MKRQRGVALITAMLIVTLVTIVGTTMLTRMNFAVHRSGNIWLDEQAWWYAVGVERWLGSILRRDREDNEIDSLNEAWAEPVDVLPIEGGGISGQVFDLQGRFNLNNLAGANPEQAMRQLERLIRTVSEADPVTARTVAQSLRDWIDPDINATPPQGAEDDYYLNLTPAYRAANQRLSSPSELRAVRGMSAQLYRALEPHITALPEPTPINVNTATLPVLASLAEQLDLKAAESLAAQREEEPWESVREFLQEDELAALGDQVQTQNISVATGYFGASGTVNIGRVRLNFHSVLARDASGETSVVRHSRNVD